MDRVIDIKTFELKIRFQLEKFFFGEGWASRTNPNNAEKGFTHTWTYNDDTIKHFIEDMVRWSKLEFRVSQDAWIKYNKEIADNLLKNVHIEKLDGQELQLKIKNALGYEQEIYELKEKINKLQEHITNLEAKQCH